MRSIRVYAAFAVTVTAVFALSSFTSSSRKESQTEIESEMHIHSQKKYCSGTVGWTVLDSLLSQMVKNGRNHIVNIVAIKEAIIDN